MTLPQSPDEIAHRLVTNVGSPVRVFLEDGQATIPSAPCGRNGPPTREVSLEYFDAVLEDATIEDGGLSLFCVNGLHLPASEWVRTGLDDHWRHPDADLECPFFPPQRKLEVWASREDALFEIDDPGDVSHLTGIPPDSPIVMEWAANDPDDIVDRPPVPFDRPKLSVYAIRAEGITDVQGFDRVDVGTIARVDLLDELAERPSSPDIEPREVPFPPSRHPEIDYDEIEPIPWSDELLKAVFVANRHAKRFDARANAAHNRGDGAGARVHALRKRALYRVKTVALHRLCRHDPGAVDVVRHDLNGDHEMLCFYLGGYSYHQPVAAVAPGLLSDSTGTDDHTELPVETIEFEASTETKELGMSLPRAIDVLRDHGIEPNDYLDASAVEDYSTGIDISTLFSESTTPP